MQTTNDFNLIHPLLKPILINLFSDVFIQELPFVIFETYRSSSRQDKLFEKGVTKARAGQSAHNFGLAVDVVLDVKRIEVKEKEWRGKLHPWAWDNETPSCIDAWLCLGVLCKKHNLEWGGNWKPKDENGIGWDHGHIEFKGWQNVFKQRTSA